MPNEMDTEALLNVGPEELASSLLKRRLMLKESLPGVIRNLEAEEDSLTPKVERGSEAFQAANKKVSNLKGERDDAQIKANIMVSEIKEIRERLNKSGGMISLDPKWKKRKLIEEIEKLEYEIQTSALDQRSERKLLERRRELISENDKWLKDRKDSNPDMMQYIDKSKEMSRLFKKADKAHSRMLDSVERAQSLYEKSSTASEELREIKGQLDRARELLSQSDKAIGHWERRLEEGFGQIAPGFKDLLRGRDTVRNGGPSTFSKRSRSKNTKKTRSEEE